MKKFLLSAFTFISMAQLANAQWVKQDTAFTGGSIPAIALTVNDIYAVDANVVWAISNRIIGNSQFFSNQWSKTIDGGATWTHGTIGALTDTNFRVSNICAVDANTAFACFYGRLGAPVFGGVYKTSDGGATWTVCNIAWAGLPNSFPNLVHFFDANNGVVIGDPDGVEMEIFTTSDGGTTWTAVPAANKPNTVNGEYGIVDVYDAVGDTLFFGTTKGRIYSSTNKGLNWSVFQAQGTSVEINTIRCKSGTEIVCSGAPSGVTTQTYRKSVNGGTNWITVITSGTFFRNGYTYVPSAGATPSFWMSFGNGASGSGNVGHSVSSDFATSNPFIQVDSIFHYHLDVVDGNTAYAVGRFPDGTNPNGTSSLEKISSFSPYRAFLGLTNISNTRAKVGIMPNPSKGVMNVITENLKSKLTVTLVDVLGKVISNESISNTGTFKLDYSNKQKGVYFLAITDGNSKLTQRIVIE